MNQTQVQADIGTFCCNESHLSIPFRCQQSTCLATGEETPLRSGIEVRDNSTIVGWVNKAAPIKIWMNSKVIERVEEDQLLEQPDGRLGFQRELTDDEKSPGMKLIRVYAMQQDISTYSA